MDGFLRRILIKLPVRVLFIRIPSRKVLLGLRALRFKALNP